MSPAVTRGDELRALAALMRELAAAHDASDKAMDARASLPPGSSRAKVTTANARWTALAEERERLGDKLRGALWVAGFSRPD